MVTALPVFLCLPLFLSPAAWHFPPLPLLSLFCAHFSSATSVPPFIFFVVSRLHNLNRRDLRRTHQCSTGTPCLSVSLFHGESWQLSVWPRAKPDKTKEIKEEKTHTCTFSFCLSFSHKHCLCLTWDTIWFFLVKVEASQARACCFSMSHRLMDFLDIDPMTKEETWLTQFSRRGRPNSTRFLAQLMHPPFVSDSLFPLVATIDYLKTFNLDTMAVWPHSETDLCELQKHSSALMLTLYFAHSVCHCTW